MSSAFPTLSEESGFFCLEFPEKTPPIFFLAAKYKISDTKKYSFRNETDMHFHTTTTVSSLELVKLEGSPHPPKKLTSFVGSSRSFPNQSEVFLYSLEIAQP